MTPLAYLIRKDTHVWVARRIPVPSRDFELFKHTMKNDMMFVYPCVPLSSSVMPSSNRGAGVVALSKNVELLDPEMRAHFRTWVFTVRDDDPGPKRTENNMLSLLESGYDWFATGNILFPWIAASYMQVLENPKVENHKKFILEYKMDCTDPNKVIDTKWDTEDKGDGLKIYRQKLNNDSTDAFRDVESYRQMMEMTS